MKRQGQIRTTIRFFTNFSTFVSNNQPLQAKNKIASKSVTPKRIKESSDAVKNKPGRAFKSQLSEILFFAVFARITMQYVVNLEPFAFKQCCSCVSDVFSRVTYRPSLVLSTRFLHQAVTLAGYHGGCAENARRNRVFGRRIWRAGLAC